jgi:hypothetical protein
VTDDLSVYDIPFSDMEQRVHNWIREAIDLRHGAANDPEGRLTVVAVGEDFHAYNAMLVRVRQRSDRVDGLLANATQARSRARRALHQAKFEAELAYDSATQNNRVQRTQDFVSREERHADAALDSLEQRRIAHRGERMVSITEEAYEVINQIHWQLDAIRKDLRSSIHSLQFESSLER